MMIDDGIIPRKPRRQDVYRCKDSQTHSLDLALKIGWHDTGRRLIRQFYYGGRIAQQINGMEKSFTAAIDDQLNFCIR